MSVRIIIDNKEIKNPVIRFIVALIGLVISVLIFALLFFLFLPFIWFLVLLFMLLVLVGITFAPKVAKQYRLIILERKK